MVIQEAILIDNKVLWAIVGLLFLASAFNAYNSYILGEEVQKLSEELNLITSSVHTAGDEAKSGMSLLTAERSIPIVAVSNNDEGVVGDLTVRLIPGSNNVLVNTNPFTDTDIQYSANKAVEVAKQKSDYKLKRDFLFDYKAGDNAQLIGGESAGAASTVALIAAIENKTIRKDTAITGTIESDGTIGEVGGVIEKAKAISDAGYKRFIVPKGQSNITYDVRQVSEEPTDFGFTIRNVKYVPKTLDLKTEAKKEWNLDIIEASNIDDALKNMVQ